MSKEKEEKKKKTRPNDAEQLASEHNGISSSLISCESNLNTVNSQCKLQRQIAVGVQQSNKRRIGQWEHIAALETGIKAPPDNMQSMVSSLPSTVHTEALPVHASGNEMKWWWVKRSKGTSKLYTANNSPGTLRTTTTLAHTKKRRPPRKKINIVCY